MPNYDIFDRPKSYIDFIEEQKKIGRGQPFLWGVSTAGFQSEGSSPDSNWLRYSNKKGNTPIGKAVDFWNRYEEDITNAAAMGANTFRLSLEWARLEPRQGDWDEEAAQHYDRMLNAIHSHGMQPMVTLLHHVYPGWLLDQGGILAGDFPTLFARHAGLVAKRWGRQVDYWLTINEADVLAVNEVLTIRSANIQDLGRFFDQTVQAHKLAYAAIHNVQPGAMVSSNVVCTPLLNAVLDPLFFDRIGEYLDYLGLDYYHSGSLFNLSILFNGSFPELIIDDPSGIYEAVKHYSNKHPGVPIIIVENGMLTKNGWRLDGAKHRDYINDIIFWLQRAVGDGYPVVGYCYWSLTDNYEWGHFDLKYGLYSVDHADPKLKRVPTDGVRAYAEIIHRGGVPDGYQLKSKPQPASLNNGMDSLAHPVNVQGPAPKLSTKFIEGKDYG